MKHYWANRNGMSIQEIVAKMYMSEESVNNDGAFGHGRAVTRVHLPQPPASFVQLHYYAFAVDT
jgi:hypothetical protein